MCGRGCRVAGCRVYGAGCEVHGVEFRVQGAGLRVYRSVAASRSLRAALRRFSMPVRGSGARGQGLMVEGWMLRIEG